MAENNVTTGVRITVDASDIQNKFTKSVDELNASLTKSQKALGLFYNEQGILSNALGQTVEGLTQNSIKLGQYVDELGRVRTFQGGFIDGLSRTQIELGQYVDELGNLYNRYGELIGQTEKARKAQDATASSMERAADAAAENAKKVRDSLSHSVEGISKVAGQFAIFQQLLQKSADSSSEFGANVANIANAFSIATGSFKSAMEMMNGLSEAVRAVPSLFASTANAASVAAPAVAGLGTTAKATGLAFATMGGPITLAISAIAALSAGLLAYSAASKEAASSALSTSFEELDKKAKSAGTSVRSLADALKVGAFADAPSEIGAAAERINEAREALNKAVEAYNRAYENSKEAARYSGQYVMAPSRAAFHLDELDAEFKNSIAAYNDIAARYVAQAKETQRTEEDKINEQKAAYQQLLKVAEKVGEKDDANLFRRQIEILDQKILDARAKQAQAAEDAAKKEREAVLEAAGVSDYLKQHKAAAQGAVESLEDYKKRLEAWKELVGKGALTSEEFTNASTALADEFKRALSKKIGVEIVEAQESVVDAFAELAKALKDGAINQKEYDATKKAIEKKELEEAERRLGISFDDMNRTLTYAEKKKELASMLEKGKITQEQYNWSTAELEKQERSRLGVDRETTAQGEYNRRMKELDEAFKNGVITAKDRDRFVDEAKTKLAKTMGVSDEAIKEYEKKRKKAEEDYTKGLITAAERDKRINAASKKLDDEKKKAEKKEEADRKKQGMRAELGVDAVVESLKTPAKKYEETIEKIGIALRKHAITAQEADALRQNAAEVYLKAMEQDAGKVDDAANETQQEKRRELSKSLTSGSEELYLAQVRNLTSNYQATMQATTARIEAIVAQSLQAANLSTYYLREIADGAAPRVWA